MTKETTEDKIVVLFDGVCNLCNGTVQFIIRNDKSGKFRFASLQSAAAEDLLKPFDVSNESLYSILVIEDNKLYEKSDAALRIAANLDGGWSIFGTLRIIPRFLRNPVYDLIARYRYKWFGRRDECMIPTPELKARFL